MKINHLHHLILYIFNCQIKVKMINYSIGAEVLQVWMSEQSFTLSESDKKVFKLLRIFQINFTEV